MVLAGEWLVVSGQLGVRDGAIVHGGAAEQARQALANLSALLEEYGASLEDVVKTTVFMTNIEDFGEINEFYAAAYGGHRPARSAVALVGLPSGASVEIEAWALMEATGPR